MKELLGRIARIALGLLFVVFLWSPAVSSKDKDREKVKPLPLFMDPEFQFSQVETICLASVLDLRSDKTTPLFLSERGPGVNFSHTPSANQETADILKKMGYQTAECNPVSATLSDLKTPSETWLRNLDFGQSSWLFVLGVEDLRTVNFSLGQKLNPFARTEAGGAKGAHAVVSGFLFKKQADTVRLVWRDRAVGLFPTDLALPRKKKTEAGESAMTVYNGISRILAEFEVRKGRPHLLFAIDEENFAGTCDTVWTTLKDVFNGDSKKYKVESVDELDKMAFYAVYHNSFNGLVENENHVVLKAHGDGCVMQVTQSYNIKRTDDWDELAKRMRASLSK